MCFGFSFSLLFFSILGVNRVFLFSNLFYIFECFVCMYVWAEFVPGSFGGQKRLSSLLKSELQVIMSYLMGARKRTRVLCKNKWP